MADATLPMDIIATEILSRLPAKSLLRFKCVSKFFQTLISTPEFVHSHLLHSLSSDDSRLLILMGNFGGFYSIHLDSPEFTPVQLCFPGEIDKGFRENGLFAVGSCNGLVCIDHWRRCLVDEEVWGEKFVGELVSISFMDIRPPVELALMLMLEDPELKSWSGWIRNPSFFGTTLEIKHASGRKFMGFLIMLRLVYLKEALLAFQGVFVFDSDLQKRMRSCKVRFWGYWHLLA